MTKQGDKPYLERKNTEKEKEVTILFQALYLTSLSEVNLSFFLHCSLEAGETPSFSVAQQVFLDESVRLHKLAQPKGGSPVTAIPPPYPGLQGKYDSSARSTFTFPTETCTKAPATRL